jgi:hypothetical protein
MAGIGESRGTEGLNQKVSELLADAGVKFEHRPTIKGLQPDFLIKGPSGNSIIVETKSWPPQRGSAARAARQARLYEDVLDAEKAFLVLEGITRSRPAEGVVALTDLKDVIRHALEKPVTRPSQVKVSRPDKILFAAMPFAGEYDDTFLVAMSAAAEVVSVNWWKSS